MDDDGEMIVLMCGKGACKCPQARFNVDGSVDIIDTDDGRDELVHLSREQAMQLRELLAAKL